jgi:hypothetical protein
MDDSEELIKDLNRCGLELAANTPNDRLEVLLAEKLNTLIRSNFNELVQVLYRIDISEARLQNLLKTNTDEDAGLIIARLILERQYQKIFTRRQFQAGPPATDEERW